MVYISPVWTALSQYGNVLSFDWRSSGLDRSDKAGCTQKRTNMQLAAVIFPALLSLVVAVLPGLATKNGVNVKSVTAARGDFDLVLDDDWTYFLFTNVGVPVGTNFIAQTAFNQTNTGIELVDLFCSGDRFAVLNNGSLAVITSPPTFGTDCTLSTANATLALSQPYWSKGRFGLAADTMNNITVVPTASPWTAGMAAIRWMSVPVPTKISL